MKSDFKIKRNKKGFGLVEAVTSAVFVIVAVILSLDCWFMITAARVTDAACRDAARAAAQASDSITADHAASAAIQPYAQYANSMMTAPEVVVTYNGNANPPCVTVVTTMSVTPLIPLSCMGSSLSGMNFSQQYTFPLIKAMTTASVTHGGSGGGAGGNGGGPGNGAGADAGVDSGGGSNGGASM